MTIEKRRHVRVERNHIKPEELYIYKENRGTLSLKLVNLSQRGAGFLLDDELKVNDVFNTTIILPDPRAVVLCNGIVRFRQGFGDMLGYGIELLLHEADEEFLDDYVTRKSKES